jgi:hypothetical protein
VFCPFESFIVGHCLIEAQELKSNTATNVISIFFISYLPVESVLCELCVSGELGAASYFV